MPRARSSQGGGWGSLRRTQPLRPGPLRRQLYLHQLEVVEGQRRQGIGRALLVAFMRAGAQAGATTMFLTTGEVNAAARALYDSLGGGLAVPGPTVNYWFRLNR